jgi:transketolase
MTTHKAINALEITAARERCRRFRLRILELSQGVPAVHIAPAFSCLELVDAIYFHLMRRYADGTFRDTFLMSKGHGSAAQYVTLEELGILTRADLDGFCKPGGKLGTHPDHGIPGVEAATGSLGHGLPITLGMTLADKLQGLDRVVHIVLSDGELQEGSVWEAMMLAPTLRLTNLIAYVDLNDFQTLGQTSKVHPNFYPVLDKIRAFGWEAAEVDGHDHASIIGAVQARNGRAPFMLVGRTVKGKGVSYMENVPIWHYRSPSPAEYQQAVNEIREAA